MWWLYVLVGLACFILGGVLAFLWVRWAFKRAIGSLFGWW